MANNEELKLYNSMNQQKEVFKSHIPGKVSMYVCGVTSYDFSHLGHARAAVAFDILFRLVHFYPSSHLSILIDLLMLRYLQHLGYEVTYVRNFTDIDDKALCNKDVVQVNPHTIIRRANELGEDPLSLSSRFCEEYLVDMNDLQCLLPTHQPRVTDHMEQIKDMITQVPPYCVHFVVDQASIIVLSLMIGKAVRSLFPSNFSYRVMEFFCCVYAGHIKKDAAFKILANKVKWRPIFMQIIEKDCAYSVEGDVFFAVDKSSNYGQLSGQRLENNRAGERVAVDSRKRNPADFALWKAAKPGEPSWESPWGPGRPGWHIECSAMSAQYLTFKFDIHGGGIDLIFPHHENEIAQSCAACEESSVSYWLHNGHVTNNNEKMSKSLGNFFTIRQITERYHPLALRHFLISAHYRSPLNYSVSQLESSSDALFYIYQTLQDCEDALLPFHEVSLKEGTGQNGNLVAITADAQKCISRLHEDFENKMSDDLNTSPLLTGVFQEALKFINGSLVMLKKKQQKKQQLSLIRSVTEVKKEVTEVLRILGLFPPCTCAEVLQQLKGKALKRAGLAEDDVMRLIEDRAVARKSQDFKTSDQIRTDLSARGIALMDVGKETVWRPCVPVEKEENAKTAVEETAPPPQTASS
ncbi:hypothetical protein SADUNF_Sadunf10G0089700 [Salix dunnii]|uniref:cysteine--tRNA ligase n=1 Tax=Salix dunnii TaxID=1413687 RepID=A0A835JRU9_9ROSI|nr:hypothetical protein SADUNF_Sadunf10G0089700 [Salix dunnii]